MSRQNQRGAVAAAAAAVWAALAGCSLVTVKQEPFPPLEIRANRPPPPARVVLTASSIKINDKVQFELGSANLMAASHPLLNEVAQVLRSNEQIALIQVEGHTDSSGSAMRNRKLSLDRARSVVDYLVSQGIARKRLVPKGMGPDRPIADNASDQGREANRRVEFNIVKQGPKKVLVQEE
jgi:outer membrane protein OmpA-like peptidoglycan-associated protein